MRSEIALAEIKLYCGHAKCSHCQHGVTVCVDHATPHAVTWTCPNCGREARASDLSLIGCTERPPFSVMGTVVER